MSKLGGGVGADFSNLADKGAFVEEGFYTNSKLDWIEDLVRASQKVSQGSQRRGYSVPFISIDDAEFYDLLARCDKKNSDKKDPLVSNNVGISLPIGFWKRMEDGDKELRKRFLKCLSIREASGQLYLIDIENCNQNQSPVYAKLGHIVSSTNICTEVLTPKYEDKSFVCVIASLNAVHWDEIKANPQIIKDAYMYLDINVSEFIRLTEGVQFMEKARKSAIEKRDIGLGLLGFHEYIQSKDCAFGDVGSRWINKDIFSTMRKVGEEYTAEFGAKLGSPAMCQEAEMVRRNVSLMMVAPNKSTSFLCDTDLGVEPSISNYFVKSLAGIQATRKNKRLTHYLIQKGMDTPEVWNSILNNLGSAQHLDFLSDSEKAVVKTASEISPKDIIDLAADRQVWIDMAQSINLWKRPNYTKADIYEIHKYAFEKKKLKTLYYFYSQAHAALEKSGEKWDSCESCAD
jgi:ribonucleoside-diphosphate reductase alpha chain